MFENMVIIYAHFSSVIKLVNKLTSLTSIVFFLQLVRLLL